VGHRHWNRVREANETDAEYRRRVYWKGCHDVEGGETDNNDNGFAPRPYIDEVTLYESICREMNLDPSDPNQDDDECNGYKADNWARHQMYRGAVGIQTYPAEMCLSKKEVRGSAFRRGLADVELLFLPAQRAATQGDYTDHQVMSHNGLVYLHPVRYQNETGDFVSWCLSTIAVMRSIRQYLWYDSMLYLTRRLVEFSLVVATEVQNDLSFPQMVLRWAFLQRTEVRMEATWPPRDDPSMVPHSRNQPPEDPAQEAMREYQKRIVDLQRLRNARAGQMMRCSLYDSFNRHIQHKVEEYDGGLLRDPGSFRSGYLVSMIPTLYDHAPVPHTEMGLMRALHRQCWLADYIVEFAGSVAPRVDGVTDVRRNRNLASYLGVATSLLTFAPGFSDRPHWSPRFASPDAGSLVPRIDLTHNHRYQRYRAFLYARQHFYDPPAPLYAPDLL
jgi:hypothetical protein